MSALPPPPPSLRLWVDFLDMPALKLAVIIAVAQIVIQGPSLILAHLAGSLATRY